MGSSNMTSAYGPVENPWRRRGDNRPLVPGGSSGGSAAAVAARAALARDRHRYRRLDPPAGGFCGIVGIKPTYGRCSRWGIVAFASLARPGRADDAHACATRRSCCSAMAGHDPKDFTSAPMRGARFRGGADRRHQGPARSASPRNTASTACRREIEALWQQRHRLAEGGRRASRSRSACRITKYALPTYYIIAPAEASSNLARYDGVRFGLRVHGRDARRDVREDARRGLRRRGASAAS